MVPSSIKPASRSTTRFDNAMPSFEQAVKSEITLKQMTNAIADSERSIERKKASQSVPQFTVSASAGVAVVAAVDGDGLQGCGGGRSPQQQNRNKP